MTLLPTLAAFAIAAGLFALASWRAARPADPLKPRMAPWRAIILTCGVAALLLAVHIVNLLGVETGAPR